MQLSQYLKIYPSLEKPDSIILFSTQNASSVLVPVGLIDDIRNGNLSEEEKDTLANLKLITPSTEEEKQNMLSFIRELNEVDRTLKFVVVLNLDCNLGCRYCFEGTRKGKFYLSAETADRFINFVKRRDLSGKEKIKIAFYGGEPLLSMERIVEISEKMRAFGDSKGLKYGFSLVTNGTLLTPAVVKRLKPLGLQGAKVTLDGPEDVHNLYRPFKSGAGSFDTIFRNVKDVCNITGVQIGGNYTKDSFREFPRLLDNLIAAGLTPGKVPVIKFDPVINENSEYAPPDFHDGCESSNEPWISDAALYLREEILRRGYRTQKIMPSSCLLERDNSFVVNVDGALYKCPGMIGREQCRIGNVETGLIDYRESYGLDVWKNDECLACAYLPLCFGGCKYVKIMRDGNMQGVHCQKEYFDRTLGSLVSQDIRYDL